MKKLIIAALLGIVSLSSIRCSNNELPDTSSWITDGGKIRGFVYTLPNDNINIVWIKKPGYYDIPKLVITPHLDTFFINYND